MNLNYIPIVGWLLSVLLAVSLAVPFWFIWNRLGFGHQFFYWLPEVYQNLNFGETVGLFIVCSIIRSVLYPKFSADITVQEKDK